MAHCVNGKGVESMTCWPSTQHLVNLTAQDRKTVLDGMRRLREAGFIVDTGERRGNTGQVAVYRLNSPKNGTASGDGKTLDAAAPTGPNSAENGMVNETVPETGPVPKTDSNSTEFPYEQSQISLVTVPKTGHGITKEQVKNNEGASKKPRGFDASLIELPDWLDRDVWQRWARDRKQRGKPITEDAARLQVKKLAEHLAAGYAPETVIDNAIENSWQGLYEPKNKPRMASKHAGFQTMNYREGVTADGTLI
ncbi:hypothetical protein VVAX_04360 [Variovorax paradoxus]|uniref:Helix-turn-helix domain-containing protein n=1 Tax=Variovorax paradoxus TaxID=34073 RepID=A0A679J998_VARPD|nr:hypothetical protein VVAX_04360 [Variovorax paradoxus]